MVIGACLFILVFILITPASRALLMHAVTGLSAWTISAAPFSFLVLALVIAAPVAAIYLMKTWPTHVEPENPMAKYRRDAIDE